MGHSDWSTPFYDQMRATRQASGTPDFAYSQQMDAVAVDQRQAHADLNPKGLKVRESRDSDAHPESNAIIFFLDVTASMLEIPSEVQKKLPDLMGLLIKKDYIPHPQILFGAFGDTRDGNGQVSTYASRAPLQIGQFESGVEMDDQIRKLYLEGGGGGQMCEASHLAMYFAARHTSIDCLEKRGKKGYFFLLTDEKPWDTIRRSEVQNVFGGDIEADIPTRDIAKELEEKYEVIILIANSGSYSRNPGIKQAWVELFGENVLELEKADAVAETVALTIGVREGRIDADTGMSHLDDIGASEATKTAVARALVPLKDGSALRPVGVADGLDLTGPSGAKRL